jgi:8-oxo-dGTP pyrophosphatase MutT (NUDIX family)
MGSRIREIRQQRAQSVSALARVLGINERTVRYWESGRSEPTKANLRRLARALGVQVQELRSEAELKPLAAGVVVRGGRVLLTQRRPPGHGEEWSFPSGKVEKGESLQDALIRELREELLITGARVADHLGDIGLPSGFRILSVYHVVIPPDAEPRRNGEQRVRSRWMTRAEVEQAFAKLPPNIARESLRLVDQVLDYHERGREAQADA